MKIIIKNNALIFKEKFNNLNAETISIVKLMLFYNFSTIILNTDR